MISTVQPANIQFPWSDSRTIPEFVRGTENDDMHTNRLSCQCAYNPTVWDSRVEDFFPQAQTVSLSPADSTKAFSTFFEIEYTKILPSQLDNTKEKQLRISQFDETEEKVNVTSADCTQQGWSAEYRDNLC